MQHLVLMDTDLTVTDWISHTMVYHQNALMTEHALNASLVQKQRLAPTLQYQGFIIDLYLINLRTNTPNILAVSCNMNVLTIFIASTIYKNFIRFLTSMA